MKSYLFVVAWLLGSLSICSAQTQFGRYAASFPFGANRLLADPVRPRIYASVPSTNTVAVIDVDTLSVVANVPVGTDPAAMAIARDGTTLFVLDAAGAINVVNLDTLQALPSIQLPSIGSDIAAGLNGQLYVCVPSGYAEILQVDSATGTVQVPPQSYDTPGGVNLLQISPDGQTLYGDDTVLSSYDVSGGTPVFLQESNYAQPIQGNSLTLSHNGKYLCAPTSETSGPGYPTILYSTAQIGGYYGTCNTGGFPGPCAFSLDDSLLYQARDAFGYDDATTLELFDTNTFALVASTPLPQVSSTDTATYDVRDMVLDHTGSYLFVSHAPGNTYGIAPDTLVVVTTGMGAISQPVPLPAVSITSASPTIPNEVHATALYNLLRVGGDLSRKLKVSFKTTATYIDGTRSVIATGKVKFAANESTTTIRVELVPGTISNPGMGVPSKLVVKLLPEATYALTKPIKAKVLVIQ